MNVNIINELFPNTVILERKLNRLVLTLIVAANKSISPLIFNFKLLKSILSSLKTFDWLVGTGTSYSLSRLLNEFKIFWDAKYVALYFITAGV